MSRCRSILLSQLLPKNTPKQMKITRSTAQDFTSGLKELWSVISIVLRLCSVSLLAVLSLVGLQVNKESAYGSSTTYERERWLHCPPHWDLSELAKRMSVQIICEEPTQTRVLSLCRVTSQINALLLVLQCYVWWQLLTVSLCSWSASAPFVYAYPMTEMEVGLVTVLPITRAWAWHSASNKDSLNYGRGFQTGA